MRQAQKPFRFFSRLNLLELTGRKAKNIHELLAHLKEVPEAVIYHHTHHFLEQHLYLSPEPPNDFAYWIREILGELELGERLAAIDTCEFDTIEALRKAIIQCIEESLSLERIPLIQAPRGHEFHFLKAKTFILPTPYEALNLKEFLDILKVLSIDSLYFHIFESRLRLGRGMNDFSLWLRDSLEEEALAKEIDRIDPYTYAIETLRQTVCTLVEERIKELEIA